MTRETLHLYSEKERLKERLRELDAWSEKNRGWPGAVLNALHEERATVERKIGAVEAMIEKLSPETTNGPLRDIPEGA